MSDDQKPTLRRPKFGLALAFGLNANRYRHAVVLRSIRYTKSNEVGLFLSTNKTTFFFSLIGISKRRQEEITYA
jgi:hypothetical protein